MATFLATRIKENRASFATGQGQWAFRCYTRALQYRQISVVAYYAFSSIIPHRSKNKGFKPGEELESATRGARQSSGFDCRAKLADNETGKDVGGTKRSQPIQRNEVLKAQISEAGLSSRVIRTFDEGEGVCIDPMWI
jgi:hypothetical protein